MAISAVSSIQAGGIASLFRVSSVNPVGASFRGGAVPRIEPVLPMAGREDASPMEAGKPTPGSEPGEDGKDDPRLLTLSTVDPRRADSILSRGEARQAEAERLEAKRLEAKRDEARQAQGKPDERLAELMGQKSAIEARQAQEKGQRSAEVASELSQLKARDSEVRSHEAAHMAAGGRYVTGGASYTYQKGPDGGQYAVGGEVGIDTSPVPGKPEETVQKMRTIRAAALAPSDPSAADLSVAAAAAEAEAAALAEIAQARIEELVGKYRAEAGSGGAPRNGEYSPGQALDAAA
jgi:hypothetical protein